MQIAITNTWHDDNKGDCGIVVATISLLRSRYPQAKFTLVSMFAQNSPFYSQGHRHLQQLFPELSIVPSPFFSHDTLEQTSAYQKLAKFFPIPQSLLYLKLPLPTQHLGLQALRNADLIVTSGGQYLRGSSNQYKSLYVFYRLLYPLLIAQKYQIPYLFFSQSFEFKAGNRVDNRLIKSVCDRSVAVWAREPLSYQALQTLGVSPPKISLVPDAAIAITPSKSDLVKSLIAQHKLDSSPFWVVTVKDCQSHTASLLAQMTQLIEQLFDRRLLSQLVLISNSHGPTTAENDRLVTQQLARNLGKKSVAVIEADLTPNELAAIYGDAEFAIGTRFQSLILALAEGTPVYGISYAGHKVKGLMTMLGMPELCSSVENLDANMMMQQIEALDFNKLSQEVSRQVELLQQQLTDAIASLTIS